MKRRAFIAAMGSAAAWPFVVRAEQPATAKVGLLSGIQRHDRQLRCGSATPSGLRSQSAYRRFPLFATVNAVQGFVQFISLG
jgi:hypothetical protein